MMEMPAIHGVIVIPKERFEAEPLATIFAFQLSNDGDERGRASKKPIKSDYTYVFKTGSDTGFLVAKMEDGSDRDALVCSIVR